MPAAAAIIALPTLNGVTTTPPPINGGVRFKAKASSRASAVQQLVPFPIGSSVKTNNQVNVRLTPGGTLLGTHPGGATAVVTSGPTNTIFGGGPVTWLVLKFPSGVNGYVGADNLTLIAPPPPATYLGWIKALSAAAPGMTTAQVSKWLTSNPPKSD